MLTIDEDATLYERFFQAKKKFQALEEKRTALTKEQNLLTEQIYEAKKEYEELLNQLRK